MSIMFRKAVRDNVNLLIGLISPSGGGKTFSALRMASGMSGDKPFAFIDTEAGRGKHYADQFEFDYADIKPPFTPEKYSEAILAAEAAGYGVCVVDSMSHEWSGAGGILEMQEAEIDRMSGGDWKKAEKAQLASWIKPKGLHKKMVQRSILQVRMHLILCFRAEEKTEPGTDEKGRFKMMPKKSLTGVDGWMPTTEKSLPYELTCSVLLLPSAPGVPRWIKVQHQHAIMFPQDRCIDEESGKLIAKWAHGTATDRPSDVAGGHPPPTVADSDGPVDYVSVDQALVIDELLAEHSISETKFCRASKIEKISLLPADNFERAKAWIAAAAAKAAA